MIHLRGSAMPRIMSCHASIQKPGIVIDCSNPASIMGDAAHKAFELSMKGEDCDLAEIARQYHVEEKELCFLHYAAMRLWGKISPQLEIISSEGSGELLSKHFHLTGHPDLECRRIEDGKLVIIDLKTGYIDKDVTAQTKAYACMMKDRGEGAIVISLYSRLGYFDVSEYTAEDLDDFVDEISWICALDPADRKYSPSPENCMYCPLAECGECPAKRTMIQTAAEEMNAALTQDQTTALTPREMGNLYSQSRLLKKVLKAYEDQLKELLEQEGEIETDEGTLYLKDKNRTSIEYRPDLLMKYLDDETINGLISIGKTKLEAALCATAPCGEKKKFKDSVMLELQSEGALKTTVTQSITLKKEKK